ncbi:response regulator transcription factor [Pikeienuella piscinae]|uniref:Response regulator transcription factor n=1 Tax=Pikeienuella piscinae TaxID=2748098 RepID=A0A7L5BZ60_9RHOB|nr:response regulator transcription factor [Pikeienuella piscinae]QIE55546.1 response regulator transcription factor [Pikeienuella piscinae]
MSPISLSHRRAQPITVAVIDKNPLVRRGLDQILREDGRFDLVMSAADGEAFLADYAARGVAAPVDVAVSGWVMARGGGGKSLLQRISAMANPPKVVIYTGDLSDMALRAAIREGAAGLVHKSEQPERLLQAIAAAANGGRDFPAAARRQPPMAALTKRERELLAALADGATNNRLAEDLGVSVNTVKFHLRNLYEKLDVRNRAQAVAIFLSE